MPLKTYSFSAFKDYNTCQLQFFHVRIAGTVKRTYDGASDGKAFHKVLEEALKHNETTLPSRWKQYNWVLERIRKIEQKLISMHFEGVTTRNSEMGIGVTVNWEPQPFFHKDNFYCGQLDFLMYRGPIAYLTDWKFGRSAYADVDQLYQQATLAFAAVPQIQEIRADLTFVKEKIQVPALPLRIKRDDLAEYKADIFRQAGRIYDKAIQNDPSIWEASPSGLCNEHCPVPRSLCEHSGKVDSQQDLTR